MPKRDPIVAAEAIIQARIKYWRQWGITAAYTAPHRATIERAARAIRRGPDAAGRAMERALMAVEAPYHEMLRQRT